MFLITFIYFIRKRKYIFMKRFPKVLFPSLLWSARKRQENTSVLQLENSLTNIAKVKGLLSLKHVTLR